MKKLLFVAVLGVIALSSCKKDKDCTCTTSSDMTGYTPVSTSMTTTDGKDCDEYNTSTTSGTYTVTMKCVEK